MPRRGSFERRLLVALVLFSLVPSLLLVAGGTYLLSETVALQASQGTWERLAESGRALLEAVEGTGDPRVEVAAERHREELSGSLVQSGRWDYLNERLLRVIPLVALVLAGLLVWLAVRSARGIARELARPIHELVGWSERVAREERLPLPTAAEAPAGEFGVLRKAFREMAAELEASRARALEAERARTWVTVARGVAHELKNALTPLQLAVRTLERRKNGDADARDAVEVIGAEAGRLEELARAFSQFGSLPEGPMSEIDVVEMLEYLLRTHLPPGTEHRVRAPEDLPHIHGHHDALSRAFANLLLNAAEAMGGEGGTVTVEIGAADGAVEVRVLDSGPGIPEGYLPRIWEPDFTTKSRGTGLGLALVRQAVHAHGGRVSARTRPEGGAEFRVVLPVGAGRATSLR